MTPAARAEAAIGLLDAWLAGENRAEPLLRAWGRANRYAGSKDRRAVADIVYEGLRRRRSLGWMSGAAGGRGIVHGLALVEGWPLDEIFSGARYAPAPLAAAEREGRRDAPPDPVRFDHPDWLEGPLKASLGARYAPSMVALGARAPVDLRVNRLKCDRAGALAALAEDGVEAAPLDLADALRCAPGAPVARSRAYLDGLIELQDAASQEAAAFGAAAPGEWVLDFCAGGGGKTLAFAALMGGNGRVIAHDAAPGRMRDLPPRAKRAGATVELADRQLLEELKGACDLVFVDAPCSGAGTWRRDPETKWRLTPEGLEARISEQRAAFSAALDCMKPGGRIVYATCSIIGAETGDQARFLAAAHGLFLESEMTRLPGEGANGGADGFYAARLRRG
ncbi:RsmB/NOP family class I SAM-dependent RNA methyltransferase [Pikeienuella piscinae]|uniref:RsmB/NOP family class I SAM-dependent RNA methyltransferase n=1 Tax=Pikeienuella piscinae TaxID=2748098 RepID=A0A7L5BYG8_9RHOB|nr:RsmB/NOP family class I SAM-dependent RNA methyltransferase [Pikeienuella piscinae]QIE54934.1 RsmB/NOP family class I SAM-dependent RNA methyltransferase [Pikeienuella piscinae]